MFTNNITVRFQIIAESIYNNSRIARNNVSISISYLLKAVN